jgi:hypothetical protein
MWKRRSDCSSGDLQGYGRRAAKALGLSLVLDRSLDMLLLSETNQVRRNNITRVRLLAVYNREEFIAWVGEIYASAYTMDQLKTLVGFLEGPVVERRTRQVTMEFLDWLMDEAN